MYDYRFCLLNKRSLQFQSIRGHLRVGSSLPGETAIRDPETCLLVFGASTRRGRISTSESMIPAPQHGIQPEAGSRRMKTEIILALRVERLRQLVQILHLHQYEISRRPRGNYLCKTSPRLQRHLEMSILKRKVVRRRLPRRYHQDSIPCQPLHLHCQGDPLRLSFRRLRRHLFALAKF